jgi:hypothetical protein
MAGVLVRVHFHEAKVIGRVCIAAIPSSDLGFVFGHLCSA